MLTVHSDEKFDPWLEYTSADKHSRWVLDSGATACATFDEADCINVRECSVPVTAAGRSFIVTKMGTALIPALDSSGRTIQLRMSNTLISPHFAHKLIALHVFTRKGHYITMTNDRICVINPNNPAMLLGFPHGDSPLFFLQQPAVAPQPAPIFTTPLSLPAAAPEPTPLAVVVLLPP